ncbi:MAG: hydrogenase expression/formation C-terminal domain-containing protein [Sulfuricella sp.]|nr:hydrogenase expression/formation C-terminal domain-containing protein [Sulfuricella sp.]
MSLKGIAIDVETADPHSVGNAAAILSEIASRLKKFAASGETSLIDLKSLPFSPYEYEQLRFTLGRGEISANLDAIGTSEIIETQFPGVWWVTHYNVEGDIVADLIEIAAVPNILLSQPEDVRAGLERLHAIISQSAS